MKMNKLIFKAFMKYIKPKMVVVGVPVIIKNSKNEILLGKRHKKAVYWPNMWGVPGGLADPYEKIIDTAKREVKEETGVDIKILKKSKNTYEVFPTKECPIQFFIIVYYGKIIKGIPKPKDETQEVKWFTLKQLKKMELASNHKEILIKEGIIK